METSLSERLDYYYRLTKACLRGLFAVEPIIINSIALLLCGIILAILNIGDFLPDLGKHQNTVYTGIQLLAAYQVIVSARKSLILPALTIVFAGGALLAHMHSYDAVPIDVATLKEMMLVGILAMGISIFVMR